MLASNKLQEPQSGTGSWVNSLPSHQVTDRGLTAPAQLRDLGLRQAFPKKLFDDRLPIDRFHASQHIGLPVFVNRFSFIGCP